MARDEDFKERRRREEREADQARPEPFRPGATPLPSNADPAVELEALLTQIPPTLEQLDSLYRMFVQGLEKRPPLERRAWVDAAAAKLLQLLKATPTARFRAQTVHASYVVHRDLWDKMLKDKERR